MRIACVYTVDEYETIEKPLSTFADIPFGISMIATILKEHDYDVDLLVLSRATVVEKLLGSYIADKQPRMVCLTAVSSQFHNIENVARVVKEIDPSIYVVLGGHHASLAPNNAIESPYVDAICVGEGDRAIVALASALASVSAAPTGIPSLWIKNRTSGSIEKTPSLPFIEDLDSLPHIDRSMWEPWIVAPQNEVSVLVGRGCPYKCTYCSNHALAALSTGKFVRYRSPADMVGEIDDVCRQYPLVRDVYLEVETIGASIWDALELFKALAEYNSQRSEKLKFGMNLAVHSNFVKQEEKLLEFFAYCQKANVVRVNIGLESGSERIRKVMRRPHYSNAELITFASMARKFGISISVYTLIGLPDETPKDFLETVEAIRAIRPEKAYLSIFYPYIGTDIYDVAKAQGMIPASGLEPTGERKRAILNLPGFPRWRLRFEYVVFWYRAYKGIWPLRKILVHMARAYIAPHPRLEAAYRYISNHSTFILRLRRKYQSRIAVIPQPSQQSLSHPGIE